MRPRDARCSPGCVLTPTTESMRRRTQPRAFAACMQRTLLFRSATPRSEASESKLTVAQPAHRRGLQRQSRTLLSWESRPRDPLNFAKQGSRPVQRCSATSVHTGSLDATGLRIGVVIARFNDLVTKLLLEGALDAFKRHGGADSDVVWVPGSFEIPLIAKSMAKSGKYDAVLTIGAVVRGATTHYEAVVNSATGGSLSAGLESGVPVVFGVLTTETMEQALDRAGGKVGNKGFECAVTAIEMANLMKSMRAAGMAAQAWGIRM